MTQPFSSNWRVKKVILDENLPQALCQQLADFDVVTVQFVSAKRGDYLQIQPETER